MSIALALGRPAAGLAQTPDIEKKLFWLLGAMLVLMLGMYVFFVNVTVMNIVARQATLRQISSATSHISDLEREYLTLSAAITPEYAHAQGFAEAKTEIYATRKSSIVAYARSFTAN